jgi:glycosyltransferase involved in cell wall biosynthesis
LRCAILFTESSLNIGGQELQALTQMQALRARGVDTLLVCAPGSRIGTQARALALPVVDAALRSAGDVKSLLVLRRVITSVRPVAVVCHSGHDAYLAGFAVKSMSLAARPRLLRMRTYPSSVKPWLHNHVFDRTLTPSQFLRRQLLDGHPVRPERVGVLYPGIDFDALNARAAEPLASAALDLWLRAGTGPVLTLAAMLRAEKGHEVLLRSLARVRAVHRHVRCVLAGEGPERERIAMLIAELGLGEQVFLAGFLDNVAPLLKRSNLVVVPSLAEPLGMTQIEALALGVPVLASRVGGIPETVAHEQTGLLVPPGDVDAWEAALLQALAQPERLCEMADRGRRDVRERFSIETNLTCLMTHAGVAAP